MRITAVIALTTLSCSTPPEELVKEAHTFEEVSGVRRVSCNIDTFYIHCSGLLDRKPVIYTCDDEECAWKLSTCQ